MFIYHCMKQDLNLKTFIHGHHRRISRRIYGKRGRSVIGGGGGGIYIRILPHYFLLKWIILTLCWNGLFLRCVNPNIWIGASSITDLSRSLEINNAFQTIFAFSKINKFVQFLPILRIFLKYFAKITNFFKRWENILSCQQVQPKILQTEKTAVHKIHLKK